MPLEKSGDEENWKNRLPIDWLLVVDPILDNLGNVADFFTKSADGGWSVESRFKPELKEQIHLKVVKFDHASHIEFHERSCRKNCKEEGVMLSSNRANGNVDSITE